VIKSKLYNVPKYLCPAPVSKLLRAKMERMARGAFAALECSDFARIDFRTRQEDGEPYVLEVNPLAGLQEGISDIVMAADADGLPYVGLINGILKAALVRYGMI
jgi:D-alanine-D-alanine ligase